MPGVWTLTEAQHLRDSPWGNNAPIVGYVRPRRMIKLRSPLYPYLIDVIQRQYFPSSVMPPKESPLLCNSVFYQRTVVRGDFLNNKFTVNVIHFRCALYLKFLSFIYNWSRKTRVCYSSLVCGKTEEFCNIQPIPSRNRIL